MMKGKERIARERTAGRRKRGGSGKIWPWWCWIHVNLHLLWRLLLLFLISLWLSIHSIFLVVEVWFFVCRLHFILSFISLSVVVFIALAFILFCDVLPPHFILFLWISSFEEIFYSLYSSFV
jgi:hypothetical protein